MQNLLVHNDLALNDAVVSFCSCERGVGQRLEWLIIDSQEESVILVVEAYREVPQLVVVQHLQNMRIQSLVFKSVPVRKKSSIMQLDSGS